MRYFLGVDSGGSKAAYALVSETGEAISLHVGPGYARTIDSTDTTVSLIGEGVKGCLAESPINLSAVESMAIGLSFYGELAGKDAEMVAALKAAFVGINCYVTNDSEVGWAGSLAGNPGINIVAGTGAIAYGRNATGKAARAGGWAPFFGDEGSCYWLGRKTMELFSKQADGRLARGPLYDLVRRKFSLGDDFAFIELMERDYLPSRKKVAELQILLEEAAVEGDPSSFPVYEECTDELALCIAAVADQLGLTGAPFAVSYSGGLFQPADGRELSARAKERYVTAPLRAKVGALGGRLQKPLLEPWQGAAICAVRESCPELLEQVIDGMLKG
ncbi:MAG: ATPase [Actinomycetia bacterium]|nr:ATPase [Actinomycetes bacterium]